MAPQVVGLDEARSLVAALAEPGVTRFVGVDGPGGAGKSTLAGRLAATVPGAVVVSVDEFSGPEIAEWDWRRLREEVVVPLIDGRPARYESRSWEDVGPGEWRVVEPGHVVIIEGVSATRDEAQVPWALRIWVQTPPGVRLARVLGRDGNALRRQWLERWIPSEEAYVAAQHPDQRADLIVAGAD